MVLDFEVKRIRMSVTQQEAHVYCNGEFITNFGDGPKLIKPGEKYYGGLVGGWASTTPDAKFIYSTLFHKLDEVYHISEGVRNILERTIAAETEAAERRPEE
ncbi:hypothetical protein EI53_01226 [Fusobacterium naviforme]|nr:hypothetical protein F7P78_06130 [Fusobacterium naviforme]PSL10164.1 hypothetical protein EI53_01226 [Fusobacterium naviforme]STO27574.1 Uncharacterised protein [Fusobacterium naviforme]